MFKPSTAPRWKMAMSTFCLAAVTPATVLARNVGANPRLTSAIAPSLRKMRREIMTYLF